MAKQRIANLIAQEVKQPSSETDHSSAVATTQNTPLADLTLTSQGLFEESKAIWNEFVEFDREHQLTQRVGAQLWRLTKAIGKPALMLSIKGIQTAVVTVANPDNRTALLEHFKRSQPAQTANASLDPVEE